MSLISKHETQLSALGEEKNNLDRKSFPFPTEFVLFTMGGFRLCPSGPWT